MDPESLPGTEQRYEPYHDRIAQAVDTLPCPVLANGNVVSVRTAKLTLAATRAAEECAHKVRKIGMQEVEVRIRGAGSGRESAVTALQRAGLKITAVEDRTGIPHNGCRPRKRRRV